MRLCVDMQGKICLLQHLLEYKVFYIIVEEEI